METCHFSAPPAFVRMDLQGASLEGQFDLLRRGICCHTQQPIEGCSRHGVPMSMCPGLWTRERSWISWRFRHRSAFRQKVWEIFGRTMERLTVPFGEPLVVHCLIKASDGFPAFLENTRTMDLQSTAGSLFPAGGKHGHLLTSGVLAVVDLSPLVLSSLKDQRQRSSIMLPYGLPLKEESVFEGIVSRRVYLLTYCSRKSIFTCCVFFVSRPAGQCRASDLAHRSTG